MKCFVNLSRQESWKTMHFWILSTLCFDILAFFFNFNVSVSFPLFVFLLIFHESLVLFLISATWGGRGGHNSFLCKLLIYSWRNLGCSVHGKPTFCSLPPPSTQWSYGRDQRRSRLTSHYLLVFRPIKWNCRYNDIILIRNFAQYNFKKGRKINSSLHLWDWVRQSPLDHFWK